MADVEVGGTGGKCIIFRRSKKEYSVYLVEFIDELSQLLELMELLSTADKSVTIRINIHCLGGDIWTAMALISAMRTSQATIITKITGLAISAAALVFMAGQKKELSKYSILLIHNYSCKMDGKNNE